MNSTYYHATRNTISSLQGFSSRNHLFFLIMLTKLIIEQRRNFVVNRRYKHAFLLMRSCRVYVSFNVSCQVNRKYLKCKKCYRKNWKCDLAPNY